MLSKKNFIIHITKGIGEIKGEVLVNWQGQMEDEVQYAYYLYKDDMRIALQWYSENSHVSFSLGEIGCYFIKAFVTLKDEKISLCSEKIMVSFEDITKIIKVDIFGSCVSRDIFAIKQNTRLDVGCYIARESIVSAVSKPIFFEEQEIKLESRFQKKQVMYDLDKTGLKLLAESKSPYLIIDLIDDRFNVIKIDDSIITLSNELVKSGFLDSKKYSVLKKSKSFSDWNVGKEKISSYIERFCKSVENIYESDHIFIHEAYMANKYFDENGNCKLFAEELLDKNKKINEQLKFYYNLLKKNLPDAVIIDTADRYVADYNHKWGLSPMHYQQEYYIFVLGFLYSRIFGNR